MYWDTRSKILGPHGYWSELELLLIGQEVASRACALETTFVGLSDFLCLSFLNADQVYIELRVELTRWVLIKMTRGIVILLNDGFIFLFIMYYLVG